MAKHFTKEEMEIELAKANQSPEPIEQINEETLRALGAEDIISDLEFPPPTAGVLMLLDVIDSPFISGRVCSQEDVYKALYIIINREKALRPIYGAIRAERAIAKFAKVETPEKLEKYLTANIVNSAKFAEFDEKVAKFACDLGVIDIEETISNLEEYLSECFGGFDMVPKSDEQNLKKKVMMPNG